MPKDRSLTQFRLSEPALQRLEALANPGESLNLAAKRLLEEKLLAGVEAVSSPSKLEGIENRLNQLEKRLGTLEEGFDGLGYAVHRLDSISQYGVDPEVESLPERDWELDVLDALEQEELEKRGRRPVDQLVDQEEIPTLEIIGNHSAVSVDQEVDQQVDQEEELPIIDYLNSLADTRERRLSHQGLAKKLGVTPATLTRHRKSPDFERWVKNKDFQGIPWKYDPVAKIYVGRFPELPVHKKGS